MGAHITSGIQFAGMPVKLEMRKSAIADPREGCWSFFRVSAESRAKALPLSATAERLYRRESAGYLDNPPGSVRGMMKLERNDAKTGELRFERPFGANPLRRVAILAPL